jgi:hypothetical protein
LGVPVKPQLSSILFKLNHIFQRYIYRCEFRAEKYFSILQLQCEHARRVAGFYMLTTALARLMRLTVKPVHKVA